MGLNGLAKEECIAALLSGKVTQQDIIDGKAFCTVTGRVKNVKQPHGGYLSIRFFDRTQLGDGIESLHPKENIQPVTVGTTVDSLTRYMTGNTDNPEIAFEYSFRGINIVCDDYRESQRNEQLEKLEKQIDEAKYELKETWHDRENKDKYHNAIKAAVILARFESVYRAGLKTYMPPEYCNAPDNDTIENIEMMVERSIRFLKQYGPKIMDNLTFEGGYTFTVSSGDGDYMTDDTLWDFKVSKNNPTTKHTLQLLIYWRMGIHSIHSEYQNIKKLGIYNPRQNIAYQIDVTNIPKNTIREIEQSIIGYTRSHQKTTETKSEWL